MGERGKDQEGMGEILGCCILFFCLRYSHMGQLYDYLLNGTFIFFAFFCVNTTFPLNKKI